VTITCSATNAAGLTTAVPVFVKLDRTAPVVAITAPAEGAVYGLAGTIASAYTCADSTSGVASCTGPVSSGAAIETATTGVKSFTVTAVDAAGNQATLTRNYSVGYLFTGFSDPLGPAGNYVGEYSAGKAIPVKFALRDGNSNLVSSTTAVQLMYAVNTAGPVNGVCPVQIPDSPPVGAILLYDPSTNQTGNTQLRATTDGFVFNWDTPSNASGCYTLVVQPAGGGKYGVSFLFRQ
jgi:hypothetical protein